MAKKSKAELLDAINKLEGINEDAQISLIEDITDTIDESGEDWEKKYHELDDTWKKKYKDRFFSSAADEPEKFDEPERKPLSFDDLFTVKE